MKSDGPRDNLNDEVFEKAVREFRERIYLMILKYVRNKEDARDLTQDTFVRAYRSRGSFRGDSSIYTWLFRIAVNLALNFKSRNRLSSHISIEDSPEIYHNENPTEGLEKAELHGRIDMAVGEMPKRQKMIFVLRYYEGLPFAGIAESLGITESAAKANYHHAVVRLREKLGPYLKGEI